MILDVRTMYIAMAATCFIVAAALLTLQTRRFQQDGALQWALGWALQGAFWALLGLRGIIGDSLSIVVANTLLTASYSFLYAAVRRFRGRSCNTGMLLSPIAATFIFFWYFSTYVDNLLYRVIFISLLSILQISGIVWVLLRNAPVKERLSYWLTGFAFLMAAMVMLNRLVEGLTLPYGQLSVLHATTFRNAGSVVSLGVVVLSSIGFVLMIRERADEALRESEEHYRSLFDNMLNGFAHCKMLFDQGKPKDFIYLNVNNAFETLTGLKNVTGRKVSEVIPGIQESDQELFEIYGRVALTGTPERFERYVEALGMWFSISVYSPRKEYFVAVFDVITERKRMEHALRESEERYRTLFEKSLDAVILTDPSGKGTILSANPAACRMFGRTEQEMIGLSRNDLFAPHQPELENLLKGRERIGRYTGELTYRRADGTTFPGEVSTSFFRDSNGNLRSVAIVRDITERKQAEASLRGSEEKLRLFIEHAPAAIAMLDRTMRYMAVSHRWLTDYRLGDQDIIGRNHYELFPEIPERWKKAHQKGLAGAIEKCEEDPFPRLDGRVDWVRWEVLPWYEQTGEIGGIIISTEDITERKQAEEAVQTTLQRFYSVLSSMYTGLLLVTDESRVEFANQAFCDYFDLNDSPADLVGLTSSEIFAKINEAYLHPDEAIARIREIVDRGDPVKDEEVAMRSRRKLLRDFTPVHINGKSYGRLWYHTDITERKRAEEALQKAHDELELRVHERTAELSRAYEKLEVEMAERTKMEEQLLQAQKMEAVGTLAGGIAHDFNNILAAIIGFTEMVIDDVADNAPVQHKMERVLKAGLRGRDLVKQILTFSRRSEEEKHALRLSPLIQETFKLLRASIPTTIEMKLDLNANRDLAYADPSRIQQIIMNLCTNASHAMREKGGTLEVSLRAITIDTGERLPEPDMAPGEYLVLSVKDTGHGMDDSVMKRVFEPFFTTKEKGQGTGLGLAVVYGIAKSHKGGIRVSSRPGQGSLFSVYLPAASTVTEVKSETVSWETLPTGTERILLVDDEEPIVELGQGVLRRLGYTVVTKRSGREALETFRGDGAFDLVITDQTMPGMTGVMLAAELLKLRPDLPVILCTGYSESVSRETAQEVGIKEFLMKPLSKHEMAAAVRRALEGNK